MLRTLRSDVVAISEVQYYLGKVVLFCKRGLFVYYRRGKGMLNE